MHLASRTFASSSRHTHRLSLLPHPLSARSISSKYATPNPLPATFLRGGTSKGIFLSRSHLPPSPSAWPPIFLGIMGSPDPEYGRQLNGMGGGVSSLSKICVVGPVRPENRELLEQGVQVEYTFVQVGIKDDKLDLEGNCGNLTSVVGVWAVDEGMCVPRVDTPKLGSSDRARTAKGTVRLYNTNTKKIIDTTFPVLVTSPTGAVEESITPLLDVPETAIAGVPGRASSILLDFVHPGGARTGKLLPTGSPVDQLTVTIPSPSSRSGSSTAAFTIPASLVDATNPTVFIHSRSLTSPPLSLPFRAYTQSDPHAVALLSPVLEAIRQAGAAKMGLNPSAQAQPKIAVLSGLEEWRAQSGGGKRGEEDPDIVVHALSMGVLHKAVPMTVGLCLGVAANVRGSIPWEIYRSSRSSLGAGEMVRILHPGGVVDVGAEFADAAGEGEGEEGGMRCVSARVVRTGRRLMKGVVWW
ncbi:hypothetical protein AX16_009961 [Volvariella volvacea WC 439]|nr:hypothetical protein AX16_009961 [Volvariella volvacea WC 439]